METFPTFDEAKAAADPLGLTVAGTWKADKVAVYFLTSPDAPDDEVRASAFQVRHGRPMSEYEQFILGLAEQGVPA